MIAITVSECEGVGERTCGGGVVAGFVLVPATVFEMQDALRPLTGGRVTLRDSQPVVIQVREIE